MKIWNRERSVACAKSNAGSWYKADENAPQAHLANNCYGSSAWASNETLTAPCWEGHTFGAHWALGPGAMTGMRARLAGGGITIVRAGPRR